MAANRFNQLLGPQQYVNTYVPLPLDVMYKGLAQKQKQRDDDIAAINTLKQGLKVDADPHREEIRNKLLSNYNSQISELADAYMKSDDPNLRQKVNQLKLNWSADPIRLGLEKSYKNYGLYQKDIAERRKQGTYAEGIKGYDSYAFDNPFDETGNFTSFDYEGDLAKQDYRTVAQSLMSGVAKDSNAYNGLEIDRSTGMPKTGIYGQYWKTSSSRSGVSEPKVLTVARRNAEALLTDPKTGTWFVDEYINKVAPGTGHVNYNNLTDEAKDAVNKAAVDYLLDIGFKQVGLNTSYGNDVRFLDAAAAKKQLDEVNMTPTLAPGDTEIADREIAEGIKVSDVVTKGTNGKADISWSSLASNLKSFSSIYENKDKIDDPITKELVDMIGTVGIDLTSKKDTSVDVARKLRKVADANGLKNAEETLLFLANGEVTNKPILIPTTDTDKRLTAKMASSFDKDKMIYTAPDGTRLTYNDFIAEYGSANIQGIDFGDKDMPKVSVQFVDKKTGASKNASFTIPNRTYHEVLKKSSNLINNTTEKLYDVDKRTKYDTDYGNAVTNSIFTSKSPEDIEQLSRDMELSPDTKLTDLKPINVQNLSIGTVYTYSDKGNVKAILYTPGRGYIGYPSLVGITYDEFGNTINSSQFRENKNKAEKQVNYTTEK